MGRTSSTGAVTMRTRSERDPAAEVSESEAPDDSEAARSVGRVSRRKGSESTNSALTSSRPT